MYKPKAAIELLEFVAQHRQKVLAITTQKSSGNGKDLLQIHVSTTWIGRNHTPVGRYYTSAVKQIGLVSG